MPTRILVNRAKDKLLSGEYILVSVENFKNHSSAQSMSAALPYDQINAETLKKGIMIAKEVLQSRGPFAARYWSNSESSTVARCTSLQTAAEQIQEWMEGKYVTQQEMHIHEIVLDPSLSIPIDKFGSKGSKSF